LATVGKGYAVAQFRHLKTAGYFGWLLWVFVHILYLVGFQNKALVMFQWAWQYFSYDRGARVITKV
jgi:NADH dehydrogenase